MVADRDLMGNGLLVPLFGHPAPIPAGPALLAVETGVPVYVASARRKKAGRYAGRLILVDAPAEGTRRERVTALTAAIAGGVRVDHRRRPEQWWGAFHPIWPDLDQGAHAGVAEPGRDREPGPGPGRPGPDAPREPA